MKPPCQRDAEGFGLARHCAGFSMRVRQVKAGVFLGQFWGKIFQIGAILGQKYRGNEVL